MKKDISNKTSIIVVAYDTHRLQRQMTSACLGNIAKYTNRDEYELILVDQTQLKTPEAKHDGLNRRQQIIDLDKHIKTKEHIGYSAACNLGYKKSNPDYPYVVFMHNDVFVWEGWLSTLRSFAEKGQIIYPHQGPITRKNLLKSQKEENPRGNDDAGLVMMSKEIFEKTGGWDERFKAIYMEAAFRLRFPYKYWCTAKCVITHLGCGTVYADIKREEEDYLRESPIYNELRAKNPEKRT